MSLRSGAEKIRKDGTGTTPWRGQGSSWEMGTGEPRLGVASFPSPFPKTTAQPSRRAVPIPVFLPLCASVSSVVVSSSLSPCLRGES